MYRALLRGQRVPRERQQAARWEVWGAVIGVLVCLYGFPCTTNAQTAPVTIVLELERDLPFGASCIPQSTLCASARNSQLMFQEVVLAEVETKREALQELPKPRLIGGDFRYEWVDFDNQLHLNLDGSIYSTHLRMLWDVWDVDMPGHRPAIQFSYGMLIPYDFFDLNSFKAQRICTIGFGRYTHALTETTGLRVTVNGNYAYTDVDVRGVNTVHTFGGGGSLSVL